MKLTLPFSLVKHIFGLPLISRPRYLVEEVSESPLLEQLQPDVLFLEIRGRFPKWLHLSCPKCGEHIQLPMAGKEHWELRVDMLRRPTVLPSIWETQSCGAHFWIRKGGIIWCREISGEPYVI